MTPPTPPPPTIELTIETDGRTTVKTRGFVGAGCQQASAFLERALGQVTGEQLTAEYHQSQPVSQTLPLRQTEQP